MKALRGAYFHDRSKLFWARHRARLEYYKFATVTDEVAIEQLVGCGKETAVFMAEHMRMSVDRIVKHNEMIQTLPVDEAKRFRTEYLLREKQHDSWCKQKIKVILERRPAPPHPFC
jgi:polyhydroxyalkanoate synthesis regulator phasin